MLEVRNLNKRFGQMQAVANESFTVEDGTIMGLIGQNGAGKTTTFRMILDFLRPDSGEVLIDGQPLTSKDYNQIGYLPEERGLYPKMRIEDQVTYFAELHGMKARDARMQLDDWMRRFDVKGKRTDKVKDLSKGNQQKIQLIATLMHMPKLVILDEPFSGLDPVNASVLEDGIRMMRDAGSAIIYSSHDMGNVASLSDHLIMLRDGEVVLDGTVDGIRESFGRTQVTLESPLTRDELLAMPGVTAVKTEGSRQHVTLSDPQAGQAIFKAATAQGYIPEFSQQAPTLDEIFRIKVGERRA